MAHASPRHGARTRAASMTGGKVATQHAAGAARTAGHSRRSPAAKRRLTVRDERRADIHQAFLTLGCCLIGFNALQNQY